MPLRFETPYIVRTVVGEEGAKYLGVAVGIRPFKAQLPPPYEEEAHGWEWIPNSPIWPVRRYFLEITKDQELIIEARSTLAAREGREVMFVFEPVTVKGLEAFKNDVAGYDSLVAGMSDGDLQTFFVTDWLRDEWGPHPTEGFEYDADTGEWFHEEAAPVGDVRYWKSKGWVEKQRDGTWEPVDGTAVPGDAPTGTVVTVKGKHFQKRRSGAWAHVPESGDYLPGRWKEKAEGLPASSHKENWDPTRGDYRPERKSLHERIKHDVLKDITPVPEDRRPVAVITMGLPAAGKSNAIQRTINRENFAHIDTDNIREQLPEFKEAVKQRAKNGGTIVFQEAANVADDLFNESRSKRMNLVFEAVGHNPWILEQIDKLKEDRYKVVVVMVHEDDVEAAIAKADDRGKRKGRFVPHKRIRDAQPMIPKNFLKAIPQIDEFSVYQAGKGREPPSVKWRKDEGNEPVVMDQEFHNKFLSLAKLEWMHYEASRRFLQESEDRKKPADKTLDDVLTMLEKAWEMDRADVSDTPETFEDGIEEVATDPVPSRI